MSLTGALNSALSGLTAMSRSANVVSDNLANALTEGFAKREIELSSRVAAGVGYGVAVVSVDRLVDARLLADRRDAEAAAGGASVEAAFLSAVENAVGQPGTDDSLSDAVAKLEASLITAAAGPETEANLRAVYDALDDLSNRVNAIGDEIQNQRTAADRNIAAEVEFLNGALEQVAQLNTDIRRLTASGSEPNGLIDQRQILIDQITQIVPVREVDRGNGMVGLITDGGVSLLDGTPAELTFTPVTLVTEFQNLGAGTLSGISVNGRELDLTRENHGLAGGTLAANLSVRDTLAPQVQSDLDAFARDLVERFQSPTVDPTLAPTDPGLFTDSGGFFLPTDELGLSRRLSVNVAVDPEAGGDLWRIRDGLGALVQGDTGQAAGLNRLSDALTVLRVPVSGGYTPVARTASGLATDLLSRVGTDLQSAEVDLSRAQSRADAMVAQEAANGVDSDQEMQRLLVIERAYTANAQVVEAIEAMFDALFRI